ncbi:hypothetical protein SNE40_003914 [Patella caerulea]
MATIYTYWYSIIILMTSSWLDQHSAHMCDDSHRFTDTWRYWDISISTEHGVLPSFTNIVDFHTCPRVLRLGPFSPEEDRSTCPYFYVDNVETYRLPSVIQEAKCNCTECFGVTADSYCKEQLIQIPVIYCIPDTTRNSDCAIRLEIETFSVGCSCYFTRTLQSIR